MRLESWTPMAKPLPAPSSAGGFFGDIRTALRTELCGPDLAALGPAELPKRNGSRILLAVGGHFLDQLERRHVRVSAWTPRHARRLTDSGARVHMPSDSNCPTTQKWAVGQPNCRTA